MIAILRDIFGTYSPLYDDTGIVITGIAGVNFEYVASVLIFSIVLISFFKLVGAFLKWK